MTVDPLFLLLLCKGTANRTADKISGKRFRFFHLLSDVGVQRGSTTAPKISRVSSAADKPAMGGVRGGADVLIADTAGRLHTQSNLMEELKKVRRVLARLDPTAPHEVLLVLDAGQGQNALAQAQQFQQAVGVTGLVMTKLDGTAKGGIVVAIRDALDVPVKLVGVGETPDDVQPFDPDRFVEAMFAE